MSDKKIEVNDEIEKLQERMDELSRENFELRNSLNSTLSMLRFTLGIAYNAHPDNDKIRGMVDSLYSFGSEDGSRQ